MMMSDNERLLKQAIINIIADIKGRKDESFVSALNKEQVALLIQATTEDDFIADGAVHSSDPIYGAKLHKLIHGHMNAHTSMTEIMETMVAAMEKYYQQYVLAAFNEYLDANYTSQPQIH